ncbi:MAG: DegV family protein, partial [Clostridia bacterium]
MKIKIISDSACDLRKGYINNPNVDFAVAPFFVNIGDKQFLDTDDCNPAEMLAHFEAYDGRTNSACPSPQTFFEAIGDAEYSFIITISASLSGSYNSARIAKEMAEKEGKKVYVIDSKATCGVQILIIDKLAELAQTATDFGALCETIQKYTDERKLLFVLRKFDNLIQN